tara:strand:+ start:219 stop:539 length:321 start_codon:yes stop_codon:yes gene_type:complete
MMPFIRSITELMAITESIGSQKDLKKNIEYYSSKIDSGQRKIYIRSLKEKEIELINLPKKTKSKWMKNKESISRFFNDLDYNNPIQSSHDLTLLDRQNKRNRKDVA